MGDKILGDGLYHDLDILRDLIKNIDEAEWLAAKENFDIESSKYAPNRVTREEIEERKRQQDNAVIQTAESINKIQVLLKQEQKERSKGDKKFFWLNLILGAIIALTVEYLPEMIEFFQVLFLK